MKTALFLAVILFLLSLVTIGCSLPVEVLQQLDKRTIPTGRTAFSGAAILTEDDPILKRGAEGLATSLRGLQDALNGGGIDDGMIARADQLTACYVKSSQGRRISILNAFLELQAFTALEVDNATKEILSRSTTYAGKNGSFVTLDDYPRESLKAKQLGNNEAQIRTVDDDRVVDSAYVSDLREVCDMHEIPQTAVIAAGERNVEPTQVQRSPQSLRDNPYARLPSHTTIVKVRYDLYEMVLQIIAVALLLLDLFIIDDFEDKELKFYHVLGILLLAIATVVTVVMGYLQILEVLAPQGFAWAVCGSYNIGRSAVNSTQNGVFYDIMCEWVVIRAKSTGVSYLVLIPSLVGGLLLLILLARFAYMKYRAHKRFRMEEQNDEEIKLVRERQRARKREARSARGSPISVVKSTLFGSAVALMFCGCAAQNFPPRKVDVVGSNLMANGEVLFLGSVASASPWRCAWESPKGPSNDTTSLAGVDDCFARWTPPKEDEDTALLFDKAEIKFLRCAPPGRRCPFTGTRCKATDLSFSCKSSLKVPSPIVFYSERTIKKVARWCSYGSETRKAFCRARFIRRLAYGQLASLTRQIKRKLGDERVNIQRISKYTFPGCAGPPKSFAGSPEGKSTRSVHFSVAGDNCVNSAALERLAKRRARKACQQKVRAKKKICKGYRTSRWRRRCRHKLVSICTDALYITTLAKSRFMRAADDWLVSRCHQGGMTKFGRLKNWIANPEAVIRSRGDVARDRKTKRPIIRPVRQGWVFKSFPLNF